MNTLLFPCLHQDQNGCKTYVEFYVVILLFLKKGLLENIIIK